MLGSDIVSGGLSSRFTIWAINGITERQRVPKLKEIPAHHVEFLKTLHKLSKTNERVTPDFDDWFNKYDGVKELMGVKSAPKHIPQYGGRRKALGITPDAEKAFNTFGKTQEKRYFKLVDDGRAGNDLSPGSIVDRADMMAQKFASLYAIGQELDTVHLEHAQWGIKLARALSDRLVRLVSDYGGETKIERYLARVKRAINSKAGNEPVSKRVIQQFSNLGRNVVEQCLLELSDIGYIYVIDTEGNAISMENMKAIPRGYKVVKV